MFSPTFLPPSKAEKDQFHLGYFGILLRVFLRNTVATFFFVPVYDRIFLGIFRFESKYRSICILLVLCFFKKFSPITDPCTSTPLKWPPHGCLRAPTSRYGGHMRGGGCYPRRPMFPLTKGPFTIFLAFGNIGHFRGGHVHVEIAAILRGEVLNCNCFWIFLIFCCTPLQSGGVNHGQTVNDAQKSVFFGFFH